ncbi:uncharacterized protein DI49_4905 [Saccharomyces eubayanus]|uniref:uncharacterized protein n=1 Tax=Saccharomyces eubayanus TaxID=1080349 RepID=UPI0006C2D6F5|nr:hypothetical protein DI49_4905 [Saccharomyces eubayanus]KOG96572.1 hypothetical protein DI49_4905 [Saccharomyces eubayanus]
MSLGVEGGKRNRWWANKHVPFYNMALVAKWITRPIFSFERVFVGHLLFKNFCSSSSAQYFSDVFPLCFCPLKGTAYALFFLRRIGQGAPSRSPKENPEVGKTRRNGVRGMQAEPSEKYMHHMLRSKVSPSLSSATATASKWESGGKRGCDLARFGSSSSLGMGLPYLRAFYRLSRSNRFYQPFTVLFEREIYECKQDFVTIQGVVRYL